MAPSPPLGITFTETALAFLEGLPKKLQRQIVDKIDRLGVDYRPPGCRMIQGIREGGEPVYRIRQGVYRILYVVRDPATTPAVLILDIDHRKDVYR